MRLRHDLRLIVQGFTNTCSQMDRATLASFHVALLERLEKARRNSVNIAFMMPEFPVILSIHLLSIFYANRCPY